MGNDDKLKNKAEELLGRGKEAVGAATDDDSMRAEGKSDQAKGKIKNKIEDAKDAITDKINKL